MTRFSPSFGALAVLLVVFVVPTSSWAAFVTTNEVGMDAIYSQGSFGLNPIDIRFNATVTIANSSLLNIDSLAKLNTLFGLSPSAIPAANMFFVDTVDYCNVFDPGLTGCASLPGNDMVVESAIAGGGFGAELNAHELGHNLGLSHPSECSVLIQLMDCVLNGFTTITAAQVAIIGGLANPLVQSDINGLFVQITPVLITAVPVPAALPLLLSAIGLLSFFKRRTAIKE